MNHRRSLEQAISGFGMDTITLAGPLEAKLEAMRDAGFGQVMLKANDLVGHPQGWQAAVKAVHASGLRGTDPKDTYGRQMGMMAKTVETPKDLEDVIAYIHTQGGAP